MVQEASRAKIIDPPKSTEKELGKQEQKATLMATWNLKRKMSKR